MNSAPLWSPAASDVAKSNLMQFVAQCHARGIVPPTVSDSHTLWQWSVQEPEAFWGAMWDNAEVLSSTLPNGRPYEQVLVGGARMAPPSEEYGPHWFTGARLNFAENLLRRSDNHPALVSWTEEGRAPVLTYRALRAQVARCAHALRAEGVGVGDRVAGWLPNSSEAVIAMLATASLGAIWSSCSPDFGAEGVVDRFGQIEPTVLIVADVYRYAGRRIDVMPRVRDVQPRLPSLRATWVVSRDSSPASLAGLTGARHWDDVLAEAGDPPLTFERLPFAHPLYILYSSGTTGLPKCIVHGAGGTLLQHAKEHRLHTNLSERDVLFYFTTCGWMMWNWLVSGLAVGCTVVLYDGAPLPSSEPALLWRMAATERVSVFGTSAKYLSALEKSGVVPREVASLAAIRCILSTGSPLAEHSYDFVYRDIAPAVQLASISGGTDIVSCFALGDPTQPVYRGELQMRGLGMAVDVFGDNAAPIRGEAGELVCTAPFPSMPVAFWNDPDQARYRSAYFDHFPGVWRHGDWAELTAHDGLVIHGRSDATLNPGGVRLGTAEIYRQVDTMPEVLESVVAEYAGTGRAGTDAIIVLCVRLAEGLVLDEVLTARIRQRIREATSPHHVPRVVAQVPDIPRTRSGKLSELAVREVLHGRPVRNAEALANPEALEAFARLARSGVLP